MTAILVIHNCEKYAGQYVATRNFQDKDVLVSGPDIKQVYDAAKEKGVDEPVIFYVPEKNMVQIY